MHKAQPPWAPRQGSWAGTGKSSRRLTALAWIWKINLLGDPWKRARQTARRLYSPAPSAGTGMPRRRCQALMAMILCFRTGSVVSKARASKMKARSALVLMGSRSPSTPFHTAHVSTVKRCVANFYLVRTARSMGWM